MIDKPISDLIYHTDIELISIPIFQRPYSWGKDQLSQFISDFDNCVDNPSQKHFYGLIVYVENAENPKIIDIIDGQQRLTTIIIFLSIIRDLLEDYNVNIKLDEEDKDDITKATVKISELLSSDLDGETVKLKTENESNFENDFLKIIQTKITDYKQKGQAPRKEYEDQSEGSKDRFEVKSNYLYNYKNDKRKTRHKTSYKNYLLLHDHIKTKLDNKNKNEEQYKYLIKVHKSLMNDFRIIPFHVESYEKAFEYFEVLNDRGLDVSALDLIKNQCLKIQGITSAQRDKIFTAWSDIFSNTLDHTFNLIKFVRYAYISEYGHITHKQIFEKYKHLLNNKDYEGIINYLENNLLNKAKIFKDINSNETQLDAKLHNVIHLLKSTKTVQWFSIAMAVLNPLYLDIKLEKTTKDLMVELLESLHEIMFTLNFVDKVANELEKKLPEIASKIKFNNQKDFIDKLNFAKTSLETFKNTQNLSFQDIDFSDPDDLVKSFEKNNDLGHMFIFFFKYKRQGSSTNKVFTSSLEHALPQKPTVADWPIIKNKDELLKTRHIYSLGNFFVTHSSENSSYGNKSFIDKKALYIKDNIFDIIEENDNLNYKKVPDWTFGTIEKREKKVIELFLKLAKGPD